jgi:hypothetical protein
MSQYREILSSPSSFQKFFKDQERCVFLWSSKSKIRYSSLSSLYPFIFTHIYHHHHLPLSPYIHSNHICRTTHMHILIWLYDWTHSSGSMVWLCNRCLQVCISCLPTYELHISLLEVGWEREGIMLLCLIPQISHILREERRHTP